MNAINYDVFCFKNYFITKTGVSILARSICSHLAVNTTSQGSQVLYVSADGLDSCDGSVMHSTPRLPFLRGSGRDINTSRSKQEETFTVKSYTFVGTKFRGMTTLGLFMTT